MSLAFRPLKDPATDAGRFLCRLALIILMIVTPAAEVASRLAIYSLLPIGAVVLCIGGLLTGVGEVPQRLLKIVGTPLGLAAILLTAWTGLSLLWTPFPVDASSRVLKGGTTEIVVLLTIIALPERTRAANLYLLPIGLTLVAAATLILSLIGPAYLRGGTDTAFIQRCSMSMVMLVFPAIGALTLRERWRLAAALAGVVVAAALAAFVDVALAAFALGALVYAGALTMPTRLAKIFGYGFAGLLALAPVLVIALAQLTAFAPHAPFAEPLRVTASLVLHDWPRLITGHGIDMALRATGSGFLPAATPRSLLFQIWYDLGLVGAFSLAFLIAGAFRAVGRLPPIYAAPVLGGVTAGLVIALCGSETTQIWWITLNGLNAIAFAIFLKAPMRRKRVAAPSLENAVAGFGV